MMLVVCLTLTRLRETKTLVLAWKRFLFLVFWVYFLLVLDLLRYATFQNVEISNIFMEFQSLVYLLFINLIKNKVNSETVNWNLQKKTYKIIHFCDDKADISSARLIQSSEIIFSYADLVFKSVYYYSQCWKQLQIL